MCIRDRSDEETVKFLSWYPFKHVEEAVIHFNNLYFSDEYRDEPQGYAIAVSYTHLL